MFLPTTSWDLMRRLCGVYLMRHKFVLYWAIFFMVVAAMTTGVLAWLMQPILDDVLYGQKEELILPIALGILITFTLRGLATYVHVILTNRIGQAIVADIQSDLFTRLITLDLAFFHARQTGALMSSVISDVNVMRAAVTETVIGLGKSTFTLFILVVVMFYQDWILSLIAFGIFPIATTFVALLGRRLRRISGSIQANTGSLAAFLSQVFQGIRQVKAYGMEDYEATRARQVIDRLRSLCVRSVRLSNLTTPVNEILVGGVVFGIVLYGGHRAVEGAMTAGQMVSFITAFTLAYEPMKKLASLFATLQIGLGGASRVFAMLDEVPHIIDIPNAQHLCAPSPDITFDNVSFAYGDNLPTLFHVSFTACAGQVTALVGPSGAGKSTIMNLILRFYDCSGGSVQVDEKDVRDITLESLRGHIALVSQDITLFDATVAENIAYGRQGANKEVIEHAARAAQAHDFIMALPQGYDTPVGENGVRLSGGQKQRVSIARALLRNAPILLLDEATSSLDNESERAVQKALEVLQQGRTTLVIAHRLSTVRKAHKIIVLDGGVVVQEGSHENLLAQEGLYAHMYKAGLQRG